MTEPYTGGCACGALRYATKHEPIFQNHCQCRDCQRRSGAGHGSYLTFPARGEVTITGEAKHWQVTCDNGEVKVHAFCPLCGTPVYLTFVARPDPIAIHAGSLDDPRAAISLIAATNQTPRAPSGAQKPAKVAPKNTLTPTGVLFRRDSARWQAGRCPSRFVPEALTYRVRGLAWDAIDSSLQAFERMPTERQ